MCLWQLVPLAHDESLAVVLRYRYSLIISMAQIETNITAIFHTCEISRGRARKFHIIVKLSLRLKSLSFPKPPFCLVSRCTLSQVFLPITPYESPVSCMKTTGWAGCAAPGTLNNRHETKKCIQLIQVSNFFRSTPFTTRNWLLMLYSRCFGFLVLSTVDDDCLAGWMILDYILAFWIELVIEIRSLEVELDISLSRLLCHLCLFSNGMPVFHKRCQSQYHWVLSATLVFKKKHDHRMAWLWHDTCSVSINKSHLLIRSRWLRNQNSCPWTKCCERARFCRKHQSSCRIIQQFWGCFKRKPVAKHPAVVIDSVSDLVRHSQQEGLKIIRQGGKYDWNNRYFKSNCS